MQSAFSLLYYYQPVQNSIKVVLHFFMFLLCLGRNNPISFLEHAICLFFVKYITAIDLLARSEKNGLPKMIKSLAADVYFFSLFSL